MRCAVVTLFKAETAQNQPNEVNTQEMTPNPMKMIRLDSISTWATP